mmetsp:Transcript_49973/g.108654  ORF Transcript_49973/g.108654 Transcript_49973/m.108654 type:complete len:204 (+) Transcript_49973:411-1022(+)
MGGKLRPPSWPACRKKTTRRFHAYVVRCPRAACAMPRSRAQRRTKRIRPSVRESRPWQIDMTVSARRGVVAFTEKSNAMESVQSPSDEGTSRQTLGSSPRKAERRNLRPASEVSCSVQALVAHFRSFFSSVKNGAAPSRVYRLSSRFSKTEELAFSTMWISGTAIPNALFFMGFPLVKPTTSASGMTGWTPFFTMLTRSFTSL